MKNDFDVIVFGAGTAGIVAAVQAARAGASTLLVEKNALPGGTMTAGGSGFPGLFYAWKKQVIAGIGWELVTGAAAESGISLPAFEEQIGMENHSAYQIKINQVIYGAFGEEKMAEAGVELLYHTMAAEVKTLPDGAEVTLCTLEGLQKFHAKRLIDCTGDAAAAALAGFEVIHPFPCQPATYSCFLHGYDCSSIDRQALEEAAGKAVAAGELRYTDLGWSNQRFSDRILRTHGGNSNHIFPVLPTYTSHGRTLLEQEGRSSLLRAWRFLRRQKGLENIQISPGAFECGVRESAVIKGIYTITAEDYITAKKFPDALCNAFYPIDLHCENGVTPRRLQEGAVPQVPLRALIPQGSACLIAAGRCISSDRTANSALRVQATAMATAQAAAAAACISIEEDVPLSQASVPKIHALLKQHGAIAPE